MNSSLAVLVVSYIFPPVGEIGAKRIAKFCRYLPDAGIRPIVLTAQEKYYRYPDSSSLPPPGIQVERTAVWQTPLDFYRRWKTRAGNSSATGSAVETPQVQNNPGILRRHVLALLQSPDPYWGWYFPAVEAGEKLIQQEKIEAIFSSGPPWISHLVARALKKKTRLPWLADFRDPWGPDPYHREDMPGWRLWLNHQLEASCMRLADRVICTTDRMREVFTKQYPEISEGKFRTLTNGFEELTLQPDIANKHERRLLLHLGSLYAGRRVDTFCDALAMLLKEGKIAPGSVEVLFLGDADPTIVLAAQQRTPELFSDGTIRFAGRIPWREAQTKLSAAELLLLFQGNLRLEIPAKLYEYMPTGKPVFAVVKQGALSDLLDSAGLGPWADPDDPTAIAEQLHRALQMPARSPAEAFQKLYGRFHCRPLTEQLAGWLREQASVQPKG